MHVQVTNPRCLKLDEAWAWGRSLHRDDCFSLAWVGRPRASRRDITSGSGISLGPCSASSTEVLHDRGNGWPAVDSVLVCLDLHRAWQGLAGWQAGGWDRTLDRDRGEVVRGLARRCAIDGVPFVLRHAPGHLEAKDIRGECLLTLRVTCGS